MRTLVEPALLLLLIWQGVWALDIPLEGESATSSSFYFHHQILFKMVCVPPAVRQPPTIIKQSMKEHIVDAKDTMVIECEAKGNPHPM